MEAKSGWFRREALRFSDEVWQVGLLELSWALGGEGGGESLDFALALCVEVGSSPLAASMPAPAAERRSLLTGIVEQSVQTSRRYPRRIEVCDPDWIEALRGVLPGEVEIELREEMAEWEAAAAKLSARLSANTQDLSFNERRR